MRLSIIIPVYNESSTILELLKRVESVQLPIEKEIVLIDDFSKDGTRDILKQLETKYRIVYHEENKGKGFAVRTGIKNATGDIIIIQDADLEYDPKDYPILVQPILDNETKVVYGSRLMTTKKHMYTSHYFGNWFLTFITNLLYGSKLTDMETCYKVMKKEILDDIKLRARRFDLEPEITAKILKKGYKIVEKPISFNARTFKEGKKITWRDGVLALYYLLKYRIIN